jgi:hypothetical protein
MSSKWTKKYYSKNSFTSRFFNFFADEITLKITINLKSNFIWTAGLGG